MSIERFTQGFGKFGPMEMNDDGEWVRYEDHVAVSRAWRERGDKWFTRAMNELNDYSESQDKVWELENSLGTTKSMFVFSMIANVLFICLLLGVIYK